MVRFDQSVPFAVSSNKARTVANDNAAQEMHLAKGTSDLEIDN
jgi:hypothetical protein